MSEAIESTQPKTATVEERFPVGSRWKHRDDSTECQTITGEEFYRARGFALPAGHVALRANDGVVTWLHWVDLAARFTRLDDNPAPPPVAEPAAPVPMVGDVWLAPGGAPERTIVAVDQSGGVTFECGVRYESTASLRKWCTFVRHAQPQPAAPAKPAPMCEFPDRNGNRHAYERSAFGCCVTCGAGDSDRRAARRQAFDAACTFEPIVKRREPFVLARHPGGKVADRTAAMAADRLFAMLEAER